jgi:hypothetical protein
VADRNRPKWVGLFWHAARQPAMAGTRDPDRAIAASRAPGRPTLIQINAVMAML